MKLRLLIISFIILFSHPAYSEEWKLVWSDEFEKEGKPDSLSWNYEIGFVRNQEAQWYQKNNAYCKDGKLIIEARKEIKPNPFFDNNNSDWRKKRRNIGYTSSSITTKGKHEFLYGRFEIKAKIPVDKGAWPAIWLLGNNLEWPSCGEIDIMEFYRINGVPYILANAAWGNDKHFEPIWNTRKIPFAYFLDKDPEWANKFHIWRMDWDEYYLRIFIDDELVNEISLDKTINGEIGRGTNPFRRPQYILLNLAIGGTNGGEIDEESFPVKYEVDYIRVFQKEMSDREHWCRLLYKISEPVLRNMSSGNLKKNMLLEVSPNWDGRNKDVSYMECFGRTMAGIAPWLTLPDDSTSEGIMRSQLKKWAIESYKNAVDSLSPDYLGWNKHGQVLVDAAYIAESFLRAPNLWDALDDITKQRYVKEFKGLRRFTPVYSNWVMFVSLTETFLASIGEQYDKFRLQLGIRKINEWYVGDGWYSDGPNFAFDYYNSFVIQPMFVEALQTLLNVDSEKDFAKLYINEAIDRIRKYSLVLESLISPEGTFPVFGRSMTYRLGTMQALAMVAWREWLPNQISPSQVRSALTAVMKNMFDSDSNFNKNGFLTLGFTGKQEELADVYTNNGSLYMTTLAFLPLGLSGENVFWKSMPEDWTSKKAWNGEIFNSDSIYDKVYIE